MRHWQRKRPCCIAVALPLLALSATQEWLHRRSIAVVSAAPATQVSSFCSCVAVIIAALAPQALRNNASVACAMTATPRCCCVAVVVPALATQASSRCCPHRPAVFVSACGTTAPTKTTAVRRWRSHQYPWPEERGQHDPIARRNKNKTKNSATTAACIACAMMTTPRHSLLCGAGNARVFVLRCCCCHPDVFVSACRRRNQQPTMRKEEEDLTSWLTPAFLSYQKQRQEKNWNVYRLFCILSVFSLSHRIQHRSWRLFFIV